MLIIGITGTLGAGKGTIVEYLVKHHNFNHFSVREYLNKIINERKLPPGRDSMVMVGNELRSKFGPSYIVEELYKEASKLKTDSIIESIRAVGEVEALKKKENFYLFSVNADPKIRYERIQNRASETDKINFDKFMEQEKAETTSDDPAKQNLLKCMLMADYKFDNNGTFEELYDQVEKTIKQIQNK